MLATNMKAQIEIIPCKVCGDKSSGVHYGVITCEGCKGFFRRSQSGPVNYQCARDKLCVIDRINRNRCQFCRLQKCLALGMSRDAVKFGRMSKKQRERVEDEASLHKRMRMNGFDDGTFDPNANQFGNAEVGFTQQMAVGPDGTQYTIIQQPAVFNPETIDLDFMVKAVSDAHTRTCLFTLEQVTQMRQQTLPQEQLDTYKSMNHQQMWMEVADKITMAVQQIIEFAKMIPGFMNLSQDDQIMLLKAGSFELALLRLSRAYDLETNSVLFGTNFVPLTAFNTLNEEETELMNSIFSFAKDMISLNLTENELALICAAVLVSSDRPGVKEAEPIHKLQERILAALKMEIMKNHPEDEAFKVSLLEKVPTLRALSLAHIEVLNKFKQSAPHMEFPALHKELFSLEVLEATQQAEAGQEVITTTQEVITTASELISEVPITQEVLNQVAHVGGQMIMVQSDGSQVVVVPSSDNIVTMEDGSQVLVTQNEEMVAEPELEAVTQPLETITTMEAVEEAVVGSEDPQQGDSVAVTSDLNTEVTEVGLTEASASVEVPTIENADNSEVVTTTEVTIEVPVTVTS